MDTNVLIDVLHRDPVWATWSDSNLERMADEAIVVINPIVYGELSIGFPTIEALDTALAPHLFEREGLPFRRVPGRSASRVPAQGREPDQSHAGLLHRCARCRGGLPAAHPRRRAVPHVLPEGRAHRAGVGEGRRYRTRSMTRPPQSASERSMPSRRMNPRPPMGRRIG